MVNTPSDVLVAKRNLKLMLGFQMREQRWVREESESFMLMAGCGVVLACWRG